MATTPKTPPGVRPLTLDPEDFKDPGKFALFSEWMDQVTNGINTLQGLNGDIPIFASIDMQGTGTVKNLAPPVNSGDAVSNGAASKSFGPAAIQSAVEATGNNILQTTRRLNDQNQRENFSTFLNDVVNLTPVSNTSAITSVAAGANSTVTVSAGTFKWGDGSVVNYAQRIDTFVNPVAGLNVYYYYLRKSDDTVQFTGPFTANTSNNQLTASADGRGFIGTAQVTAAGGGTAGGGGDSPDRGGCLELGTPISVPAGKKWSMEIEPCSDWIVVWFDDGRKLVAARNTQIAIFKKVQDLESGDLSCSEGGEYVAVQRIEERCHSSYKMKMKVEGRIYLGNGIWLSNWKPAA